MEIMKYNTKLNNDFIKNLISNYNIEGLINCYCELQSIYLKEGGNTELHCDSYVLNLDCIEKQVGRKEKRGLGKTMDISFVISESNINYIVLADFKLKTIEKPTLRGLTSDIEKKITHSSNYYNLDFEIFKNKYLIFRNKVVPVAKSKLNRSFLNRKHSLIPIDIMSFHSIFF